MINRQLVSRTSSSRIHKGRLALFHSLYTEAAAGAAGSSVGPALLLALNIEEPRHICMSRSFSLAKRARLAARVCSLTLEYRRFGYAVLQQADARGGIKRQRRGGFQRLSETNTI